MTLDINCSYLTNNATEYAMLSNLAYADWFNGMPNIYARDWEILQKKGYTFVAQYSDPATGYSGVIFQDSSGKKILANRGTDGDLGDLAADKAILLSRAPSEQFVAMVNFITNNGLTAAQFDVTGHSLGGCLAQMAAAAYGSTVGNVYTFNAPGAKNLMQTYELVGDATNPSNVVVKYWIENINNPGTGSWVTTEWRREAWNRYSTYITNKGSIDGGRIYNVSGKDTIANWGTDIGMEVFTNGSGHTIAGLISILNSGEYNTDSKKPVTIIGSKANEVIKGNYNSGHHNGSAQKETLVGGYGNDIIYAGDGGSEIYGDLPKNIIDDANAIRKSGNEGGTAGKDILYGGAGNDTIYGGNNNDCILGQKGNDFLCGGIGYDTYFYKIGDGIDIINDEDKRGQIIVQNTVTPYEDIVIGNLYKGSSSATWSNALGTFQFNGSKITFSDGGSIEIQNYQPETYGINLIEVPDNPTATNIILGDLTPIDFDSNEEGIQTQNDQWGNVITDPNSPETGRTDGLYDTTGNDQITAGEGNDVIVSCRGGNDWLLGGNGDDYVIVDHNQTDSGNDILEGNAGSDIVEGGKGSDKVFGGDYGEMEQLLAAGETAVEINARGDVVAGGEGEDYIYGSNSSDALFGGFGKDLIVGGGGNDVITGDDNYFGAAQNWSYTVTITPSGHTNIYGLTFSGINGGLDDTGKIGDDDVIYGGAGSDYIDGVGGDDEIYGGAGDDILFGSAGNDFIEGGDGDDAIKGDGYSVSIDLQGADYIDGGVGNDLIWGNSGNDDLFGGDGQDTIYGDEGDDYIDGEAGANSLYGGSGNDVVFGGNDNDLIEGDSSDEIGDDYLDGGAGNDIIIGAGGADEIFGGEGDDQLHGDASNIASGDQGDDYIDGEGGDNLLVGYGGNDILYAAEGNDTIYGDAGDDYIDAGDGENTIYGGDGNDEIYAGQGNDQIDAGLGEDYIDAGDGLNIIVGGEGNNEIHAGAGDDQISGGTSNDYIDAGDGNNIITSGAGDDVIYTGIGNDQIWGGAGQDEIYGGAGDDQLYDEGGDSIIYGGEGNDWIQATDGNTFLDGGTGDDTLLGGTGSDTIYGGADDDYLQGNSGSDIYIFGRGNGADIIQNYAGDYAAATDRLQLDVSIDDVAVAKENNDLRISIKETTDSILIWDWFIGSLYQIDQIQFSDGTVLDSLHLEGKIANTINGTDVSDTIIGGSFSDTIYGYAGNDGLYGGGGTNLLYGGDGNDWLYSDYESVNDTLVGGAGNDSLLGGSEYLTMLGGTGDDIYRVSRETQVVFEDAGEGIDLVYSDIEYYKLPANVENLKLDYGHNGTGNDLDNTIKGNANQNLIIGGAGDDEIWGYDGNDTLNGSGGADMMIGGAGSDRYYVDNVGDIVTENAEEGTDTVYSSLGYILGANLENLILTGTEATNAVGNELNNSIKGNAAANILTGGEGNDTLNGGIGADIMNGGTGNDRYYVDNAGDIVTENAEEGTDAVYSTLNYTLGTNLENLVLTGAEAINAVGNELNNSIKGNASDNILSGGEGDDTLNGGLGADCLSGGLGNDRYHVDNINDLVTENVDEGMDVVYSSIDYTLGNNLENLVLTGTDAIDAAGNELNNSIKGNALDNVLTGGEGNDTLNGGVGADTMIGGVGNDRYYVDNTGDVMAENADEGTDTVYSSISYALGANLEKLSLTGTDAINGTGNELNNSIKGNAAANFLAGGTGNDVLTGGSGSDNYLFRRTDGKDTLTETAGVSGDIDTLKLTDGIATTEPVLVKQNNDLYVFIDSGNYMRIVNEFQQTNYGIERLEVTDGHYITRSDIQNIVDTMSAINNNTGMDVMQKYNAMMADQQYQNILAQSWQQ